MRKLKLFFACLLMAVLSIGQVWGETKNFTITFKANGGTQDGSAALNETTFMNQVTTCADSISSVKPTACYAGIEALKVSANKTNGSFTVTLAHSLSISKVVLNVKNKNATVKSVTVGSTSFSTTDNWSTSEFSDLEFTGTETETDQITIALNGTTNSARVAYLKSIKIYHTVSGGSTPVPSLTLSPSSWDFETVATTGEASHAFSLTGSNLTAGDLTISVPSGYSVSPSSLSVSAGTLEATAFTVSKNTNVAGTYDGDFTIYGGGVAQANAVSASLSMTVVAPVDPDITFNNGTVEVGEDLDLSSLFTSNSEGAVTYSIIEGSSYASLSGSVLTGEVIGDVTIQASQAANAGYNAKSVTATINVVAALSKSSLIFTAACGGSGTANDGAAWTITSDAASESTFDNTKGIHYGTGTSGTGDVQYITLSTSDIIGTIKKIVVNASTASGVTATIDVSVGGDAFGGDAQSLSSTATNYTFTGSASGEIVVTITKPSKAAKALYCKSIIVSYEAALDDPAVTVNPTSVSLATPDAVNNGLIEVTYTNIDEANIEVDLFNDAECSDDFTASWLTADLNGDNNIAYTLTENAEASARTAYIRLTAPASNGTSPAIVKVIQVTQAKAIPIYSSLDAVFNAAGSDETVKIVFDNCVITGKKGDNTAYLTDKNNTYGLVIYTSGHGFNVGDVLNGTVQTTLCKFQGNSELKGLNSESDGLTVTTGGTVTPRVVDDPTTLTGANAGSVIKITGSCTSESSKYYVANVQLFDGLSSGYETPTVGDQYHCTGVFLMYNSTKEILPRQASELEHIDVPTAVITFNDFSIEKGQNITLSATVAPAAAASAEVSYSIVDGNDKVSLEGAVLTADEVGTAHIRATVESDLPNYYGATKDITVTVLAPDSRYKAEQTGFDATAGVLTTVTEGTHKNKQYISYEAKQGTSSTVPAIYDTDKIRIYQNGGLLVIGAAKGCKIDQVFLTTGGSYNSTTIGYSTSETTIASSGDEVAKNTEWNTATGLNTDTVVIVCLGTDRYTRIDVAKLDVRYTGDPVSVSSIALSGEYTTEFEKNAEFNHAGVVVTATYSDASTADVTALAEFSEPDMTTTGEKTITVSYGGQSTTYTIEVVPATLTGISLSGTYPTRFSVGDAFSHAGMTVTAAYSDLSEVDVTDDATFTGYNMLAGGVQTVTVSYGGESATYSIIVVPANTDVMVATDLVATNTQYKDFSGVTDLGTDAIYAGTNAKNDAGAIQLRTSDGKSGIVVTTANTGKIVKSVSIAYQTAPTNDRKLQVYGNHTAYTSSENLYSNDAAVQGALIGEIATDGSLDCTTNEEYEYIGLRSSDGAIYVAAIMIEWAEATPATYDVTYVSAHGTAPDAENAASVTLGELTEEGWTHTGWIANVDVEVDDATVTAGTLIANGKEVVLSAATEFTAQWTENTPPIPTPDYTRTVEINRYGTICLPNGGTIEGATLFDIDYYNGANTLYLLEVNGNAMEAGKPYIFLPSATSIEVTYTDNENETEGGSFRGLVGSLANDLVLIDKNVGNYILYNNQYWEVNSVAYVGANRAYIHMASVPTTPTQQQQGDAPRRRIAMTVNGEQTATGIDALNASETPVKVLRDGQIFILRGEKMYNVNGQIVK